MRYLNKIDFQSHYLPPAYLEFLQHHYPNNPDGYPTPDYWDMDWQQEKMRLLGIGYAHLMLSSPNIFLPDSTTCAHLAARINDQGARMAESDPEHIGFIATLPLPYERESVAEIHRALDTLHGDGVGLTTNHHGVYLGDPKLDGVMQSLDDRGAMAIIHPTAPASLIPNVCDGLSLPAFEYFVETTRAFTNMVLNDTFDKFPNIKWVIPHAGAFMTILADRFNSFSLMLTFDDPNRKADFIEDMGRVYFDLAGFSEPKQLECLLQNVPDHHLLYGSDTPYTPIEACIGQTRALEYTNKLTEEQKLNMFTGNALAVNPKLASIPTLAQAASTPIPTLTEDRTNSSLPISTYDSASSQMAHRPVRQMLRGLFPKRHITVPVPVKPNQAGPIIINAAAQTKLLRFVPDAGDDPAHTDYYSIQLKSPVGSITIPAIIVYDDSTAFHGKAKVMGRVVAFHDGHRNGTQHIFDIRVALPFGALNVHLNATVDNQGSVSGIATAPNRKPMLLTGKRTSCGSSAPSNS